MIAEFFKAFGIEKEVDEVFAFAVYYNEDFYTEKDCDCDEDCTCGFSEIAGLGWREREPIMARIFKEIAMGEVEKPSWMLYMENNSDGEDESTLYIYPKDEKYNKLAEMITKFLYSTTHEASYN